MKRDFLKKLGLEDDVIEKVMAEHGKSVGDDKAKDGEITSLKGQVEDLNKTIKERDGQLEKLKKVDAEGLQAEIAKLQGENETAKKNYEAEMKALETSHAVDAALNSANAKNLKAVKALLDMDKVSLEKNGNLIGLEDQLKELISSEDAKFLFGEESKPNIEGIKPGEGNDSNTPNVKTELERAKKAFEDKPTFENQVALSRARIESENKEGE